MELFPYIVILFLVIRSTNCLNRTSLKSRPRPKSLFDESKYSGEWFVQRRVPSTSWSIQNVTDYVSNYTVQADKKLLCTETWRIEHCNYLKFVHTPSLHPGVYNLKDSIGDVMSGESIITATDYVSYAVVWGCPRGSVNVTCQDPYVLVQTRTSFPSSFTMLTVQYVLHNTWKLSLNDMEHISQVQPCDQTGMGDKSIKLLCQLNPDAVEIGALPLNTQPVGFYPQAGSAGKQSVYFPGIPKNNAQIHPYNPMAMLPFLDGIA